VKRRYVYELRDRSIGSRGGSKAKNLRFLMSRGYIVPRGWVVSWEAFADYKRQGEPIILQLLQEITTVLDEDKPYAVRSSAAVEDDGRHSCAGLFHSALDVVGVEAVLNSIMAVWASISSDAFKTYCKNLDVLVKEHEMGVIIQEMVQGAFSGISFSKNPLTGLSETIIEVGTGNNAAQLQDQENLERWISKWGNWLERPKQGLIDEALAKQLVTETGKIAKVYGKPVDIEWVYDGEKIYYLQVRPITQLDIPIYSNRITREMLPGIIKPLVWSVNTELINPIWTEILRELSGDDTIMPSMLTGYRYSRAYFNMALFGRVFEKLGMPYEAIELLLGLEMDGPDKPHMRPGPGVIPRIPQMTRFAVRFLKSEKPFLQIAKKRNIEFIDFQEGIMNNGTLSEWIGSAELLLDLMRDVAYYNIMIPMQMMMLHRLMATKIEKAGGDIRTLRLEGVLEAANRFSPHVYLDNIRIRHGLPKRKLDEEEERQIEREIQEFLIKFGHFSDSGNDCSSIPWRETPELIRSMLTSEAPFKPSEEGLIDLKDLPISERSKRKLFRLYRRTSRFAIHREEISSLYTFGYGHFRTCFIGMGDLLVKEGVLENREEIFYLYWNELKELSEMKSYVSLMPIVKERKATIASHESIIVPEILFGDEAPMPSVEGLEMLRGIPTSLGTYEGVARVLRGLSEFERLAPGEVLVIPFSDVGWTPLFARAGAVVAESGGILSHSSIVAREYRIPAVVSVSGACSIPDGTWIKVNGHTGEVLICRS